MSGWFSEGEGGGISGAVRWLMEGVGLAAEEEGGAKRVSRKRDSKKRDSKKRDSKRNSKRNSSSIKRNSGRKLFGSGGRNTPEERAAKWSMVSNLGAINEDGEYAQAKLEDSNIAGIGSQEDKDLRNFAAKKEKAFKNAGKHEGLEIWRVENRRTKNDTPDFGVKRWPKEEYGNFFSGDSYIILNTYRRRDPKTGKKDKAQPLQYDVHFWLGSQSSQDEIGVAAYKTVELDALLDDKAVQHREVQYHESKLFMSYFKEINYMKGGIESGFRKVKPEKYQPRLLMVRHSGRNTKSFEIPCESKYMNHGDSFILDCGDVVYRWIGAESNFFERNKSGLLQHNMVNSRNGKSVKREPDEKFWKILGGEKNVRSADNPYDEMKELQKHGNKRLDSSTIRLYRISDAHGKLEFTKEGEGRLKMSLLDTNDVFLVHSNIAIWVWKGNKATKQECSHSMKFAEQYVKENQLPNTMTITSISESQARSNSLFCELFAGR